MSMSLTVRPSSQLAILPVQPPIRITTCQPLFDFAVAIVRKAKRDHSLLWVEMETDRLKRFCPECYMSREAVRNVLSRKAVDRRIPIAFG